MNRKTGLIITIVVAVLTLCCSLSCCCGGGAMFAGGGDYWGDVYVEPYYGVGPCCLGSLIWIIPLLLWFFLVRGKSDEEVETFEYQPPTPEPEAPEPEDYRTVKLDDEGEVF